MTIQTRSAIAEGLTKGSIVRRIGELVAYRVLDIFSDDESTPVIYARALHGSREIIVDALEVTIEEPGK